MADRIRCIYVSTFGMLIVGEESADSGREKPTIVTKIDKVMGAGGAEGARDVYRVFSASPSGEIKERIEIPAAFVPLVILEEEK